MFKSFKIVLFQSLFIRFNDFAAKQKTIKPCARFSNLISTTKSEIDSFKGSFQGNAVAARSSPKKL